MRPTFAAGVVLIAVALTGAGCGGTRPRATHLGPLVLVRMCGPFGPTGRAVGKGCSLQRIPESAVFDSATEHIRWNAPGWFSAAQLTGVVEVCGDAFRTPPPPPAQDTCTLQEGHVHVLDASGRIVARAGLVDGRFSFTLSPGRYRLVAWNVGNGPWDRDVELIAGETTVATFAINVI